MSFLSIIKRFTRQERGNAAIIFALASMAIVVVLGGAIDLSRAMMLRAKMQDAGDSAVLQASTHANMTSTAQKTLVDAAFSKNFPAQIVESMTTSLTQTTGTNTNGYVYKVSGSVKPIFLGLLGVSSIPLNSESDGLAGAPVTEVALVLDSTGSMSQNSKMTNLKTAIDGVLATLVDAQGVNKSGIKLGVVPFDTQVKIAPRTDYAWVNYGKTSMYQGCYWGKPVYNWPYCDITWDALDKACLTAAAPVDCKTNANIYNYAYKLGNQYHRVALIRTYESGFTQYNWTIDYWWSNSDYTCTHYTPYNYTDEYGTHTGQSCDTYSGTTWGSSGYLIDTGTHYAAGNNNDYNAAPPSGYWVVPNSDLYYEVSYPGYGADVAKTWTYWRDGKQGIVTIPVTPDKKDQWPGCFYERTSGYDVTADPATAATPATLYSATSCNNGGLQPMMGMTTTIADVKTKVDSLQPAGETDITIGVQWGMEMLSPAEPFSDGMAFHDPKVNKVMILVTDGVNTQSYWTSGKTNMDARTALACQNAKDLGITVFVVSVETGTQPLLQNCASRPPYYFNLTTSNQLSSALDSIFTTIAKIRLTK